MTEARTVYYGSKNCRWFCFSFFLFFRFLSSDFRYWPRNHNGSKICLWRQRELMAARTSVTTARTVYAGRKKLSVTAARTVCCPWRQQELSIVYDGSKNCLWRQRDLSMTAARIVYDGSKNCRWFIFIFILFILFLWVLTFVTSPETTMAARSVYDDIQNCLWRQQELLWRQQELSITAARTVYWLSRPRLTAEEEATDYHEWLMTEFW